MSSSTSVAWYGVLSSTVSSTSTTIASGSSGASCTRSGGTSALRPVVGIVGVDVCAIANRELVVTKTLRLAAPKWKGRICIRSGSHDYNLALFGMMFTSWGEAKAREVISGISSNLARTPRGGDRDQARGIFEGKCDVALMNTYYHPMMAANPEQKAWADAVGVFFPNQAAKGTFIMRSAAGLTKATANRDLAVELLEFIAAKEGQQLMVGRTKQYSVLPDVPPDPLMVKLGAEQGLVGGKFKIDFIPLDKMADKREAVIKFVNEIRFDAER